MTLVDTDWSRTRSEASGERIHLIAEASYFDEPPIDIVAIHGEGGDWRKTWTSEGGFFWLQDVLPQQFPQARIISCSTNSVTDSVSETLLWDLIDNRSASKRMHVPMIIIAHSLGGSVAKSLFVGSSPSRSSWSEAHQIHSSIKGYMFFGTLQRGQFSKDVQGPVKMASRLAGWVSPEKALLGPFLDKIPSINEEFASLGGTQVPTVCFFEARKTSVGLFSYIIVSRENATLPDAENRSLDAGHSELCKFSDSEDGQFQRVLGSLQRLINRAAGWTGVAFRVRNKLPSPALGLRVLALDGGGVKGLFSIIVLEHLMEAVRQIDAPDITDALKPCNYFDLICGTSTGGLLAIMLGRLRMEVADCKRAYRDLSSSIFKKKVWLFPGRTYWDAYWGTPWYSGENLELAIKSILSERINLSEKSQLESQGISIHDAPLKARQSTGSHCFVCALVEGQRDSDRLRSYTVSTGVGGPDCTIWEAGRATSAAPIYFPAITIAGRKYYDGGMHSNNPILELVREATQENPGRSFDAIVSLGCGKSQIISPGGGVVNVVRSVISRVTDTELRHEEFLRDFPGLTEVYSRFQETEQLGSIDLADYGKLDVIEGIARDYLNSAVGRNEIQRCAGRLSKSAREREPI